MRLAVVSHKVCWPSISSPTGYATDGGFPLQIHAISELFDETTVIVPCQHAESPGGVSPLVGRNMHICPISPPGGTGLGRKLLIPFWLMRNGWTIIREIWRADAVHAPIPGDVGTIGMILAFISRKPLFVRHCGNWLVPRTTAEHFWKWFMERFGGGRNVMLATGGASSAPSIKNPHIKWIFSSSLRKQELAAGVPRELPADGKLKLIIACRQEDKKGTDIVINSLPIIQQTFPRVTLEVIGDGSFMSHLKELVDRLELQGRVCFHGKVEQSRVLALLKQAHVFCFPTRASEGFPKVVLEALASGLPIITTRVSVLPTLIGAGGGILLDDATPSALADAVLHVCSDRLLYERISAGAVGNAQQYSLENWRDFIGENLRSSWRVSSLSSSVCH